MTKPIGSAATLGQFQLRMAYSQENKPISQSLWGLHEISVAASSSSSYTSAEEHSSWTVRVKNEATGYESKAFKLHDPFTPLEYESIRWYLEDYAVENPFASSRAEKITQSQTWYGQQLVKTLQPFIDEVLTPPETSLKPDSWGAIHLLIHGDGTRSSLHSLLWELIERIDACTNATFFTTTRIAQPTDSNISLTETKVSGGPFRILYVSARPGLENDIAYRAVSRYIWTLVKAENKSGSVVELEFVRPGSWSRFLRILKKFAEDDKYFDLVHFDMHGTVGKPGGQDMAYLHFANSGPASTEADRKSAPTIAKTLVKYRIPFAVLNACNSASPRSSINGNLGYILASYGVQYVVVMTYMIKTDTAALAMRSIYSALLRDRGSLLKAVRYTRAQLSVTRSRSGRYGIIVECDDEFNLVCYARTPNVPLVSDVNGLGFPEILMLHSGASLGVPNTQMEFSIEMNGNPLVDRIQDLDILTLEERLEFTELIFVSGESGTGKTTLGYHIQEWWTETSFAKEILYFLTLHDLQLWLEDARNTGPAVEQSGSKSQMPREGEYGTGFYRHATIILLDNVESYDFRPEETDDLRVLQGLQTVISQIREARSECRIISFSRLPEEQISVFFADSMSHSISLPSAEEASALTAYHNRSSGTRDRISHTTASELEDVAKLHRMNLTWIHAFGPRIAILDHQAYEFLDCLLEVPENCDFDAFRRIIEASDSESAFHKAHEVIQSWYVAKDILSFQIILSLCVFQQQFPQDARYWLFKLDEIGYFSSGKPTKDQFAVETGRINDWSLKEGWASFGSQYEKSWRKVKGCLVSLGLASDHQKTGKHVASTKIHPLLPYFLRYEIWQLKLVFRDWPSFWRKIQQGYWEYYENRSGDWTQSWLNDHGSRVKLITTVNDDSQNLFEAVRLGISQPRFPFRCMRSYNLIHWLNFTSMEQPQLRRWSSLFKKVLLRYNRIIVEAEWTTGADGKKSPVDDQREKIVAQALGITERLINCQEAIGDWEAIVEIADDAAGLMNSFQSLLEQRSIRLKRLLYTIQVLKATAIPIPTCSWSFNVLNFFLELLASDTPDINLGPNDEHRAKFFRSELARHVQFHLDLVPKDHPLRKLLAEKFQDGVDHISNILNQNMGLMQQMSLSGIDMMVHLPSGAGGTSASTMEAYRSPKHTAQIVERIQKVFHSQTPSSNKGYITDAMFYAMDPEAVRQGEKFVFDRARLREVSDIAQKMKIGPLQRICLQQLSVAAFADGDPEAGEKYKIQAQLWKKPPRSTENLRPWADKEVQGS